MRDENRRLRWTLERISEMRCVIMGGAAIYDTLTPPGEVARTALADTYAEPERHVLATGWPIDGALRLEPDGAQRPAIPNWPDNLSGRYRLILERTE